MGRTAAAVLGLTWAGLGLLLLIVFWVGAAAVYGCQVRPGESCAAAAVQPLLLGQVWVGDAARAAQGLVWVAGGFGVLAVFGALGLLSFALRGEPLQSVPRGVILAAVFAVAFLVMLTLLGRAADWSRWMAAGCPIADGAGGERLNCAAVPSEGQASAVPLQQALGEQYAAFADRLALIAVGVLVWQSLWALLLFTAPIAPPRVFRLRLEARQPAVIASTASAETR